ncbi:MAG: DUF1549 domain-containing protein [Planctomycetota bacterium]|nr:DUF1549 domain-containing protein [Planctomycetota bacterium]
MIYFRRVFVAWLVLFVLGVWSSLALPAEKIWSFRPLRDPISPDVVDAKWPRARLDHFVLARLEQEGLEPVAGASRRTLIRRVTFDLLGLPPNPASVEAFVEDPAPDAFGRVVDRLLASPHYGERWGRHWLDVARYGEEDTLGEFPVPYENAWRYRDWVVDAFNQDLPYSLFVQAQIAGDLLADRTDLIPGLGLFGMGPWQYGNSIPAEARADERDDRVDVLTRGFLGLTVACARCHDHKYDPITMEDYYSLAGVFRNSAYREYPLISASDLAAYEKKKKKLDEVQSELNKILSKESRELSEQLAAQTARYLVAAWKVLGPLKRELAVVVRGGELDREQLEKWVRYVSSPYRDHPYLRSWDALMAREGNEQEAVRVANEFQTLVISVMEEKERIQEELRLAYEARSKKIKEREKGKPQPEPRRTKLPNEYVAVEPVPRDPDAKLEPIKVRPVPRDRYNVWADLFDINEALEDYHIKERRVLLYEDRELDRFLDQETREKVDALRAEVAARRAEFPAPRVTTRFNKSPAYPYAMTLAERDEMETIRMHLRGNALELGPGVPGRFITALSDEAPTLFTQGSGRLELAQAVSEHPLSARVLVNRVWMHHLGKGIVETPNNFGQLGSPPSHPLLLEFLAFRFREVGGSIKALHREILFSATYQLSSASSTPNLRRDAGNRFCWRRSRRRLDVESIRDGLLFISGRLQKQLGGPSYDLDDMFRRRTLYGRVSRFKLSEALQLFDFPDPRLSAARRMSTNSPLQRLFFLNNEFVWRQATALAERLERGYGSHQARIQHAYQLVYGREATEQDIALGLQILNSLAPATALRDYAHILMSSNEFLFVD